MEPTTQTEDEEGREVLDQIIPPRPPKSTDARSLDEVLDAVKGTAPVKRPSVATCHRCGSTRLRHYEPAVATEGPKQGKCLHCGATWIQADAAQKPPISVTRGPFASGGMPIDLTTATVPEFRARNGGDPFQRPPAGPRRT